MKRFSGCAGVLIFLAGTAVSCSPKIQDSYKLLKADMSRARVIAIMGNPTEEQILQQRVVPPPHISPEDAARRPFERDYRPEILQMVWIDGEKKVTVQLHDDKLKIKEANFAPVYVEIR